MVLRVSPKRRRACRGLLQSVGSVGSVGLNESAHASAAIYVPFGNRMESVSDKSATELQSVPPLVVTLRQRARLLSVSEE